MGPFGFYDSGSRFGPSRVETTLSYFKVYGVYLDLIDEVNDAIDRVIRKDLEELLSTSREKTFATIQAYKARLTVPGFKSDTIQQSPSFRAFLISSMEQYARTFEHNEIKIPLSPGLPTVQKIVQFKYNNLKESFPDCNVFIEPRVQRPRFRKINLNFFTRVNRELQSFFDE